MNNLKYLIGGTMVGGAFGAKSGEYLAIVLDKANSFAWIETAMVFGCLIGLVSTFALMAIVKADKKEEANQEAYYASEKNSSVTSA